MALRINNPRILETARQTAVGIFDRSDKRTAWLVRHQHHKLIEALAAHNGLTKSQVVRHILDEYARNIVATAAMAPDGGQPANLTPLGVTIPNPLDK